MSNSRSLSDWISGFMLYTSNSEPPEQFRLWTGISLVAAALQRKCFTKMGMLTFYPNMYIVLVGPSGVRKGTAMSPGFSLLHDLDISIAAESTTLQALIRRLKSGDVAVIDHDYGTGKPNFHSSLTIFSEEFTVFIGYQQNELMAALCNWYDCRDRWTYETISRDKEEILGVFVNLLGATTPKLIQSSMPLDAIGGGLCSRMIMVYEEHKGKFVPFPIQTPEEVALYEHLRNDLERIYMLKGEFTFGENFSDKWIEWRVNAENSPPNFQDERFSGYLSRRPTHLIKLTMIMSASQRDDMTLRPEDLTRATALLESVEVNMGRVFSGFGQARMSAVTHEIGKYIRLRREVPFSTLMRKFHHDVDKWNMEKILETMESAKYVQIVHHEGDRIIKYLEEEK